MADQSVIRITKVRDMGLERLPDRDLLMLGFVSQELSDIQKNSDLCTGSSSPLSRLRSCH